MWAVLLDGADREDDDSVLLREPTLVLDPGDLRHEVERGHSNGARCWGTKDFTLLLQCRWKPPPTQEPARADRWAPPRRASRRRLEGRTKNLVCWEGVGVVSQVGPTPLPDLEPAFERTFRGGDEIAVAGHSPSSVASRAL